MREKEIYCRYERQEKNVLDRVEKHEVIITQLLKFSTPGFVSPVVLNSYMFQSSPSIMSMGVSSSAS